MRARAFFRLKGNTTIPRYPARPSWLPLAFHLASLLSHTHEKEAGARSVARRLRVSAAVRVGAVEEVEAPAPRRGTVLPHVRGGWSRDGGRHGGPP